MTNIILTGVGGPASANFLDAINQAEHDYNFIGVDINPYMSKLSKLEKVHIIKPGHGQDYRQEMLRIIKDENIDFIHPQPDADIMPVIDLEGHHEARTFLPTHQEIHICQDKFRTYTYLQKHNAPTPRSYPVDEKNIEALLTLENKIWLRARKGAGSKAALPVTSLLQAQGWLDYWNQKDHINPSDFMISEFLPGKEYAYQSLWYRGKLISDQARERVQYLAGNLSVTGQTSSPSVARTVSRDDVYENGEAAVRAVTNNNPHGVFCVDMKENTQGTPCITEINAGRFFTTSNFFAHAGLNMQQYLDLALTGKTKTQSDFPMTFVVAIVDMGYKLVDGSKW